MNPQDLSVESANIARRESTWQRLQRHWSVRIGGVVLALLVLLAIAAPWLGTVDPALFDAASRDLRPGQSGEITTLDGEMIKHKFLMGSDSFGRDIYSRVIYGTRIALLVGLFSVLLGGVLGTAIGVVAGYFGGKIDSALMRLTDVLLAFPDLITGLLVLAVLGPGLEKMILAIGLTIAPRFARIAYGPTLAIKGKEFIEAARALALRFPLCEV